MMASRVSLATMDAAAIDNDFASPRTTARPAIPVGTRLPSTSVISGRRDNPSTARRIANIDAHKIFNSSISVGLHDATDQIVFSRIHSNAAARARADICLESVMATGISMSRHGKITAAATTGPHRGPRPASSQPATIPPHSHSNEKSGFDFITAMLSLYPGQENIFFHITIDIE